MRYLNLCLLVLFPVAWFAPLMRAALLPIFGMDEISVVTGLQSLWQSDIPLALAVTFLAVFAPYAKTIGLALIHWNLLSPRTLPALHVLGEQGGSVAGFDPAVCIMAGTMAWSHRDPFDRLLAATALTYNLPLVSADAVFDGVVTRLW